MSHWDRQDIAYTAVKIARLYYVQGMTTAAIAEEIGTSRATVSRMLSYAMEHGLVEIRIHDVNAQSGQLERMLRKQYKLKVIQVVPASSGASNDDTLQRVAIQAASYINTLIVPGTTLGLAWGKTVAAIADKLTPKPIHNVDVVQLNGSGSGTNLVNTFGESIIARFAENYGARAYSFPVPAFFDYSQTRTSLWRERSVQSIRTVQERASVLLFSIGVEKTGSHVHNGGYLNDDDMQDLHKDGVVGDIATVFFREDGSWQDVSLNARSSGPGLDLFQRATHSVCVVSGKGKIAGLQAALRGGFINELVIDEPTARLLVESTTDTSISSHLTVNINTR
jgi:deoxyribonucleoside regulator